MLHFAPESAVLQIAYPAGTLGTRMRDVNPARGRGRFEESTFHHGMFTLNRIDTNTSAFLATGYTHDIHWTTTHVRRLSDTAF